MKYIILCTLLALTSVNKLFACAYYDPDYEFYALFAQELIDEPAYFPFLLTYSDPMYGERVENKPFVEDKNIVAWQHYFGDELTYEETNALLKIVDKRHLENWKKGKLSHVLSKQMGANFYHKYQDGFDYLIMAKSLEPYMRISIVNNSWYDDEDLKTASDLPFTSTLNSLITAYNQTSDKEIQQRYGFQIVRFLHYTRNYADAVKAFDTYVQNDPESSPIYWHAINQLAGALRGLGEVEKANYLFLKVFQNSNTLKDNAYKSIKLHSDYDLRHLLNQTQTTEEKNLVYFLLAYQNYTNPVPIMQKMLRNDANSSILKVLTARAINELERNYLPEFQYCWRSNCDTKELLLPIAEHDYNNEQQYENYIYELKDILTQISHSSTDAYWDLTLAHLHFLLKDYTTSNQILNNINTPNESYIKQLRQMKMLNDIVSQKKIDASFEEHLMDNYADFLQEVSNDWWDKPNTLGFVKDILGNRYFVQKDYAKAFLLNNDLHHIQYNPQIGLVRKLDALYHKKDKNDFEKHIIQRSLIAFKNGSEVDSFFNIIYGDYAMRAGNFEKAIDYYEKVNDFDQIPRILWNNERLDIPNGNYDGFNNISPLIFGTARIECFGCMEEQTVLPPVKSIEFIPQKAMSKLTLAKTLYSLDQLAKSPSHDAALANQLIGNVLYNTSALGYYREVFVLDINNAYSPKYDFGDVPRFQFYYKNYGLEPFAEKGDFDLIIRYYQKALAQSSSREDQAKILFQMARAEQGNYYIWAGDQQFDTDWSDPNYDEKKSNFSNYLKDIKNASYRTYFSYLKSGYAQTSTVDELQKSCSYFNYYMNKN